MAKSRKLKRAQSANSNDGFIPREQIVINGIQYSHTDFHKLGKAVMFNYLEECMLEGQYEHLKKVVDYMRLKLEIDNDPYVQLIALVAAVKTGNKEEALKYCNKNINTWSRAEWFKWKRWVLSSMGKVQEAEECFNAALDFEYKEKERQDALYKLGQTQLKLPKRAKKTVDQYVPQILAAVLDDPENLSLNPAA
jgi:tetratricopeptide (TPR) repeat protein